MFKMCTALVLLLGADFAGALDGLVVQMQGVSGPGWHTGPISVELDVGEADVLSFRASASAMRLPAPLHEARAAIIRCPRAHLVAGRWQCANASVQVEFSDREALRFQASVAVSPEDGALRLSARNQPIAGGEISLVLNSQNDALDVKASFSELNLVILQQLAALAGTTLPVTASAGQVSGTVRVDEKNGTRAATVNLQIAGGAFSDESGSRAGEGLQLSTQLTAQSKPRDGAGGDGRAWRFESSVDLHAGVLYMAPLLLEVGASNGAPGAIRQAPVALRAHGQWQPAQGLLQVDELAFHDAGVLQAKASAQFLGSPHLAVQRFAVDVPEQPIAALYARYLKPFAGAGLGADLRVKGAVSARLEWSRRLDGTANIVSTAHIKEVDVGDSQGNFSVLGLDGSLFWRSAQQGDAKVVRDAASVVAPSLLPVSSPSSLQWRSVQLRALELGAGALQMGLVGRDVDLLAPLQVDLLDGAVQVERLHGRAMGTAQQHLEMQVSLLPISLQRLSDRLAWLPLSGSISGRIPKLILSADTLRVDGDVNMELFDGKARIANVLVMHPFSALSRLRADLFVDGIDLGVLSRAFSFGQIEGRLNGEARDLVLESWQPVAFDAVLATPPGDNSRHRISQRAVDNLASLGGAQAVLSTTFLRFFKEFSYARLGLRCRLRNGICEMGGVAPASQGYYIVEGGGMPPRVDVVGFNRRVDWHTLLARLKAVTSSSGPVIR